MKNILIFGSSRSGKSTLAKLLREKYNYTIIMLDAILYTFYQALPEAGVKFIIDDETNEKTPLFASEFIKSLIYNSKLNNQYYVMEGDSITPEHIVKYFNQEDYIIIFLVQNKLTVDQMLENYKIYHQEHDWTDTWSEEKLREHALFHKKLSEKTEEDCLKYNLKCYDTSENREEVYKEILDYIEKNK